MFTRSTSMVAALLIVCLNTVLAQSPPPVSFLPARTYSTGSHPYAVAVGDFNGDGKPDLAMAQGERYRERASRSLSGIGKHKRGLAVGGRLSSAKIGSGKLGLPRLVACVRPQVPFSQPRHGFSRLVA